MRDNNVHLSDQDLLLYADGEISQHDAARVRKHLAGCWNCRARALELESTIADFVKLHRGRVDAQLPRADGIRASLKAQMAASDTAEKSTPVRVFHLAFWQEAACAAVALAIVTGIFWQMLFGFSRVGHRVDGVLAALPNRSLTPGYTRPVNLNELCSVRQPNGPPDEDVSVAQKVFREYGLPASTSGSYELDYLIAPDLGGADDVRNLWPEPYGSTDWNAHVKDELEDRLHTMVCDGQIDLTTAQKDISTDWIAAYKRYFHTEMPLPNAADAVSGAHRRGRLAPGIVLSAGRLGYRSIW